jgi:hypothetical protein
LTDANHIMPQTLKEADRDRLNVLVGKQAHQAVTMMSSSSITASA